jgi:hypothetical protein
MKKQRKQDKILIAYSCGKEKYGGSKKEHFIYSGD